MNIETLFGQSSTGGDSGLILKSDKEIDTMRKAGKVVALMLDKLQKSVYPGMSTQELDVIAAAEIIRLWAKPAFLGYYGFPATICVSVNDQIVHGIPGTLTIRSGDIVSIDAGAIVDGFYGDEYSQTGLSDNSLTIGIIAPFDGTATAISIDSLKNYTGAELIGGEDTIRVFLNVTGTPNGLENIEILPSSETTVFDQAGTSTPAVYSMSQAIGGRYLRDLTGPALLSLIHICRCRRIERCRSRWSPYH